MSGLEEDIAPGAVGELWGVGEPDRTGIVVGPDGLSIYKQSRCTSQRDGCEALKHS